MNDVAETELDGGAQQEAGFGKPFGKPFAPVHDGLTQIGSPLTSGQTPDVKLDAKDIVAPTPTHMVAGAPCGLPLVSDQ